MSDLTNTDGSHEKKSEESKYSTFIFPAILMAIAKRKIDSSIEVGSDYIEFYDEGKTITLTIKVK